MKFIFSLFFSFISLLVYSQITIDMNSPYDAPTYLINDVLLGGGITRACAAQRPQRSDLRRSLFPGLADPRY